MQHNPEESAATGADTGVEDSTFALATATPMLKQYLAIKSAHAEYVLFYRMGDFYELFFDDAVQVAAALEIALTKRGKHNGEDIPMCGVPVVSYEIYLERLIKAGFKVAVCEQVEDPAEAKKRGSKSVVKREVVRIVTPGTLCEDSLLDARTSNFLCAVCRTVDGFGLAWADISTGQCHATVLQEAALKSELARINPCEIVVSERLFQEEALIPLWQEWQGQCTVQPNPFFEPSRTRAKLLAFYRLATLEVLGDFTHAEVGACGALIEYLELTQKGGTPRLERPIRQSAGDVMAIDPATRRNLELSRTLSGERRGSLLWVLDHTVTGAGARLLSTMLAAPLTEPRVINDRLDAVEAMVNEADTRAIFRQLLRRMPDMERALSRVFVERGSPRDLGALRDGLQTALEGKAALAQQSTWPQSITEAIGAIGGFDGLLEALARSLKPELGLQARDGGFIAEGCDKELDELRVLRDDARKLVVALQTKYQERTGISSLKIKHNNVLGYFIEITAIHKEKAPFEFIHRQTMAGAMRFSTVELKELEERIQSAATQALALELRLFHALCEQVKDHAVVISTVARAIARLDVAAGLAESAAQENYCRPQVEEGVAFDITGGRHPVVEHALKKASEAFSPNDCDLGVAQRLWLLTGPNMAGKSTFLRQNALIAVMAQIGAFVPAKSARIGVVDRLFSRVGASDDLARGRSTFMVEMVETATILNLATDRSLVILDEIGRGTATFDGLSIAWAVIEHLHQEVRCRALFATHYHELTSLSGRLRHMSCHSMKVREWKGQVIFLHEVVPGTADRSYGLHVARLAGLPAAVITRAGAILAMLEKEYTFSPAKSVLEGLPLFEDYAASAAQDAPEQAPEPAPAAMQQNDALTRRLQEIEPDDMAPKEAHALLYELKRLALAAAAPANGAAAPVETTPALAPVYGVK